MTPEDFLRSITPGEKQPENLGLDKFKVSVYTHYDSPNVNTDKMRLNHTCRLQNKVKSWWFLMKAET